MEWSVRHIEAPTQRKGTGAHPGVRTVWDHPERRRTTGCHWRCFQSHCNVWLHWCVFSSRKATCISISTSKLGGEVGFTLVHLCGNTVSSCCWWWETILALFDFTLFLSLLYQPHSILTIGPQISVVSFYTELLDPMIPWDRSHVIDIVWSHVITSAILLDHHHHMGWKSSFSLCLTHTYIPSHTYALMLIIVFHALLLIHNIVGI